MVMPSLVSFVRQTKVVTIPISTHSIVPLLLGMKRDTVVKSIGAIA